MKLYPSNWKEISEDRRFNVAGNRCEFCGAENYEPNPVTGSKVILTVAHLDHNPQNNTPENLRALCQLCHLRYDAKHHAWSRKQNGLKGQMCLEFEWV
jgi:5-methylcytosine-specific restriction endonuclease McrA